MLEIGCGHGNVARWLMDRELYVGTDVSEESVERVMELGHGRSQVHAFVADAAEEAFRRVASLRLQTVFSLNALEHIDDHVAALLNAHEVLEPGGCVVLVVPAHDWLYGTMDSAIGHYRRYSKKSMLRLFAATGFACVRLKYINALGTIGWYINGRVRKQCTPPTNQLKAFNHLAPLLKRLEHLFPPPFGISLLAVGRKEGPPHTMAPSPGQRERQ